jgi:hypothetical protein
MNHFRSRLACAWILALCMLGNMLVGCRGIRERRKERILNRAAQSGEVVIVAPTSQP